MPIAIFFQVLAIPQQVLIPVQVIMPTSAPQSTPSYEPRPQKQTRSTMYVDATEHTPTNKLSAFIPKIQTYSIPGERSKVIVAFKCPSEAIDIETPVSKAIHQATDLGFSMVNYAKFVPFTLEQACS